MTNITNKSRIGRRNAVRSLAPEGERVRVRGVADLLTLTLNPNLTLNLGSQVRLNDSTMQRFNEILINMVRPGGTRSRALNLILGALAPLREESEF